MTTSQSRKLKKKSNWILKGYAGLLLAPAEGFVQGKASYAVLAHFTHLGHFWCPVVTLVTFSSNISNFEKNKKKNPKKPIKIKIKKNPYKKSIKKFIRNAKKIIEKKLKKSSIMVNKSKNRDA